MARNFKFLEGRCPKCGSFAKRDFTDITTKTECKPCDYVLKINTATGEVIDSDLSIYKHKNEDDRTK